MLGRLADNGRCASFEGLSAANGVSSNACDCVDSK